MDFYEHYSIHSSQLNSNSISMIVCVNRLKEKYGFPFSVIDFNHFYFLKMDATENGYFILNLKSCRAPPIFGLTTNDSKWKDKHYFSRGFICIKQRSIYPKSLNITC